MKKLLAVIILSLSCSAASASNNNNLITNVDGRSATSLDGKWQMIIDPYESGYYDYRHHPTSNGYFKNAKPKSGSDLIEYSFDSSETLNVPGDWNSQSEKLLFYEGTIWYKKDFDYKKKPATRAFLYFGAANYEAVVFLNGEKIGEHVGGFTPFNFEITDKVRDGSNFVIVKVDNKRYSAGVPALSTDWWNYGGLTRDVALIEEPATFIQDYFIQLQKGSTNRIAGWIRLNGSKLGQTITVTIPEAKATATVNTDDQGYAKIEMSADLKLWSPEQPKLYDVELKSETDSVKDLIGFRSIEARGPEILLNGKPIFLRGICLHEEAPFRSGRAFSKDDARTLLGWAKEMNCNFVRLAHYPHSENMIREADRLGILVWSEVPAYWVLDWENPETIQNATNQLTEGIERDKNKASVILWSLGNENPRSDARLAFFKKLAEAARSLDSTRLLTAATEVHYTSQDAITIDDPLDEYLDVVGCNEYIGWYDGPPDKCDRVQWKTAYDKPLIISEFGADALAGLHGDDKTRFTEEYQSNLYEHQTAMLKRIPFLRGATPWLLMDFRSPRRPLPHIEDYYNRKGLISDRGQKKKAFFILRDFYNEMTRRARPK